MFPCRKDSSEQLNPRLMEAGFFQEHHPYRSNEQERFMSGINGDKSRFHVARKKKIARRTRNRKMLAKFDMSAPATKATAAKPEGAAR